MTITDEEFNSNLNNVLERFFFGGSISVLVLFAFHLFLSIVFTIFKFFKVR